MAEDRKGIDSVAWQALGDHQRTILTRATQQLDLHIASLSSEGARPTEATYILGLARDWDDSMKAIFSGWYKGETWRQVSLREQGEELVIRIRR